MQAYQLATSVTITYSHPAHFRLGCPPAQQAWFPDTFPGSRCTVGVFTCVWTAHDQTRYSHGTVRKARAESSVCSRPHVYIYFQWSGLPAMCVAGAGLSLRLLFVCVSPSPHWCRTRQQAINTNDPPRRKLAAANCTRENFGEGLKCLHHSMIPMESESGP